MAKRTKPRAPTAAQLARAMARARIGPVPPTSRVEDQRRKPDKHKRDLAQHSDE
jgi:hypothetical protein